MSESNRENENLVQEKKILTRRNVAASIVVFVLFSVSLILVVNIWADHSLTLNPPQTSSEIQFQNDTIVNNMHTNIAVENYSPQKYYNTLKLMLFPNQTNSEERIPLSINSTTLKTENINITLFTVSYTYGDETLSKPPPIRLVNPPEIEGYTIPSMSKTNVSIDWVYEINKTSNKGYAVFTPMTELGQRDWVQNSILETQTFLHSFGYVGGFPIYTLAAFLLFMGFGGVYLFSIMGDENAVKTAYKELTSLKQKIEREKTKTQKDANTSKNNIPCTFQCGYPLPPTESVSDEEKRESEFCSDMQKHLRDLKHFPNNHNSFHRVIFGLSVLFFKLSVNNYCKELKETCEHEGKEKLKSSLDTYPEETATKVQDLMPQAKTIVVGLGLLASFGISFSWNVGALVPLLFSIGLFYFFFNLGSTIYLVWRSYKDLVWIIALFLLSILVVHYSNIINSFR